MINKAMFFAAYAHARWPYLRHLTAYKYYQLQAHFLETPEYNGRNTIKALVLDQVIFVGSVVEEFRNWKNHYDNAESALGQIEMTEKSLKELDLILVVYTMFPSNRIYHSSHVHDNSMSNNKLLEFLKTAIPELHPNVESWKVVNVTR
jgi:hypothetical protein